MYFNMCFLFTQVNHGDNYKKCGVVEVFWTLHPKKYPRFFIFQYERLALYYRLYKYKSVKESRNLKKKKVKGIRHSIPPVLSNK